MTAKFHAGPAIPVLPAGAAETMPCWSCGDMRAEHFCHSCGKVQPPAPADYFSFFGLPRQLDLDGAALEREMLALSRRLHPDRWARASVREQEWALEQSSLLNDAYRTLRDPVLRTEYLLRLEGIKAAQMSQQATEEARITGSKKQAAPPELLEEVFDLHEQLEEFRRAPAGAEPAGREGLEAARRNFEHKLDGITAEMKSCWREWDAYIARTAAGEAAPQPERLRLLRGLLDILNRHRYASHLLEEIAGALSG